MKTITWTKKLFRCSYELLSEGMSIGRLKDNEFSQSVTAELNDKRFAFKTNGWGHKAKIIDLDSNEQIGTISFGHWLPKATINYYDKVAEWKFSNLWETRWKIFDNNGSKLKYKGWQGSGSVEVQENDELLILAGLFVSNHYWKMAFLYVMIFFPYWMLL
jgi:hypothetical protein